jgi:hypothetical protein
MVPEKYVSASWIAITGVMISLLLLLAWAPLPTQAGPELPPRATPTPTPRAGDDRDRQQPIGAFLQLHVQGAPDGVWAVVQWQDSAENWHDVEGWRGTLDAGQKTWWVAQRDFGKGPFRWAVYQGQGGELLATSNVFNLPSFAEEVKRVELSIVR